MHQLKQLILLHIFVLPEEPLGDVGDDPRIVPDPKLPLPAPTVSPFDVVRVIFKRLMLFHQVRLVGALDGYLIY